MLVETEPKPCILKILNLGFMQNLSITTFFLKIGYSAINGECPLFSFLLLLIFTLLKKDPDTAIDQFINTEIYSMASDVF